MKRKHYCNILMAFIAFILGLGLAEIALRCIGHCDKDGNFFIFNRRLKPYYIPTICIEEKIKNYLSSMHSYTIYDENLGWSLRPDSRSENEFYFADQHGMRADFSRSSVVQKPAEDILRIAIFGDSFTHGDGVIYENTWGYCLEQNLKANGIDAEVLNFGVGGYGMDQAFLRWEKLGYKFSPDIVIFGFSAENIKRNLNLIRPIYFTKTGLPFSKPRYILENGKLEILNTPAIPPDKLINVMNDIYNWDLVKYEHWIDRRDYEKKWWRRSKLVSYVECATCKIRDAFLGGKNNEKDFYSISGEPAQLAINIIKRFQKSVEENGAKFYVVFLPWNNDLRTLLRNERLPYSELLKTVENFCNVIHPEYILLDSLSASAINQMHGHYMPKINKIIANIIAENIIAGLAANRQPNF